MLRSIKFVLFTGESSKSKGLKAAKRPNPLMKLSGLSAALKDSEALLSQNTHHSQLLKYRGLPSFILVRISAFIEFFLLISKGTL